MRLGVSGPEGKHYCATHMGQALVPPADAPYVKFEFEPRHHKAPAAGMDNSPDNVLKALVHRMSEEEEEEATDQAIVGKLSDDYGGDLLSNALRIYPLLGDLSSSSIGCDRDYNHLRVSQAAAERPPPEELPMKKAYNIDAPIPKATKTFHPVSLHGTVLSPLQATLHVPRASALAPDVAPLGGLSDVFANIPKTTTPAPNASFGTSDALHPIPDQSGPNKLLSAIVYNVDRLSNPDVSTKPGALESLKRNGEIWVFVARF